MLVVGLEATVFLLEEIVDLASLPLLLCHKVK